MADVENLRPYCWRIVCYGIRVLGDLATILVRSTQGLRSSRVLEGIEGSSKRSPVSWFFREPVWVVAAVKPDVPGRGGYPGVRRNGLSKQWLIGVAKPIPQFSEHVEDGLLAPGCVRPVRNQAKSQKQRNKSNRYARLLLSFLREWAKLQKQRPDPSSLRQRIDTFLELGSSSAVAFRSCVNPRKSFAVDRGRVVVIRGAGASWAQIASTLAVPATLARRAYAQAQGKQIIADLGSALPKPCLQESGIGYGKQRAVAGD